MTVAELIELLKTCDPSAVVIVDQNQSTDYEVVDALETGWTDEHIVSGMMFTVRHIDAGYLIPAVRVLGCTHERIDPNHPGMTLNGKSPNMADEVAPIKRYGHPEKWQLR